MADRYPEGGSPNPRAGGVVPVGSGLDRWLLFWVAVALVLRLAAWIAAAGADLVLDEIIYVARAKALLAGDGFVGSYQTLVRHPVGFMLNLPQYPGAYQPPLHTLFMGALMALSGGHLDAVRIAQILLSTHSVWLVYAIGFAWYGRRCARIAAALCAVYPNLIAFSHYLWSETLFIWLLLMAIWILTRTRDLPSVPAVAGAGIVLGLAALTRSVAVPFLPVIVLWVLWVYRNRASIALLRAVLLVLATAVVIAPWTIRNTVLHDGFVLIDSAGPLNLWRGNNPDAYAVRPPHPAECYAPPFDQIPLLPLKGTGPRDFVEAVQASLGEQAPTDLEISRAGTRLALDFIVSDPVGFVRRAGWKLIDLWNPTSFLLRHFRLGAYGDVSPVVEVAISWTAVLSYLAVLLLGALGLVTSRRDPYAWLVLGLLVMVTALHAVVFGLTRYRLPMMPFVMIFAAQGIVWLRARTGGGGSGNRTGAPGA